jgi:hypothetical protein
MSKNILCHNFGLNRSYYIRLLFYFPKEKKWTYTPTSIVSIIGCNSKENEQPILTKHHIQPIKMEHQAKINEHAHKSIYIDIYNNFLNIFKFE